MEDASLHVDAGDGGGPISVFTGSCLLSGLASVVLLALSMLFKLSGDLS